MEVPGSSLKSGPQSGVPVLTITCSACGKLQKRITGKKSEVQDMGSVPKYEAAETEEFSCDCPTIQ